MGLILDTSVLIDAERGSRDVAEMLRRLPCDRGEQIAISSVTLMEFAAGVGRAADERQEQQRRGFLEQVRSQVPVISFGSDLAIRAGLLNGELRRRGIVVGGLDLMIGATALSLDFSVATKNVRHFGAIPGLKVAEF